MTAPKNDNTGVPKGVERAIPGIWGGIVTYNPDMSRLSENVGAIQPQVERLVIFDNGSKNADDIRGAFPSVQLISNGENVGMAKALNTLASKAVADGVTDIVFLDQDSVASADLVEKEAALRDPGTGIVCCLAVDRNHRQEDVDETLVYDVKRPITSGSMVNLAAWKQVGGYDERLFVDWVDNEFCDNLRSHGYRLVETHATHILHELGHQEYLWTGPSRDDSGQAHAKRAHYRQNYPSWRWKDRARSQAITIKKYGWSRIGMEERYYYYWGTLGRILLFERNKAHNFRDALAGHKEGTLTMRKEK